MSCHTDPPRDKYVDELIKIIKRDFSKKKRKIFKKERTYESSAIDIYAGKNGKKSGGWYDIDNCYK